MRSLVKLLVLIVAPVLIAGQAIQIIPETGFYPFYFGQSGSYAYQTFYFANLSPTPVVVQVTDCFCSGDAFDVFVNDQLYTSVSNSCIPGDGSCQQYSANVTECYLNQKVAWCQDTAPILLVGSYNVSILVTNSPYYSGKAFIGVFEVCGTDCGTKRGGGGVGKRTIDEDKRLMVEKFHEAIAQNAPLLLSEQQKQPMNAGMPPKVEKAIMSSGCGCGELCCNVIPGRKCNMDVYDWESGYYNSNNFNNYGRSSSSKINFANK